MTLQRWDVINELLSLTGEKRYLEIGVQRGICGRKVRAAEKWGVDPDYASSATPHYTRMARLTSDAFFAQLNPEQRFDVVLVDGLHHADQVLRDVDNVLAHLAPDGFIVLHDCNPLSEIAQRVPRATGVWNGDCWKAMVALRQRSDLRAFTIASDHGVGVVRRGQQEPLRDVPAELTYDMLERDRTRLLGLVQPHRWNAGLREEPQRERVVVVSAIFGRRDVPIPAPPTHDADEFVMFTDEAVPLGWRAEKLPDAPKDPRLAARRVKTLAFELVDADFLIWIDGRISPTGKPLRALLNHVLRDADIAGYPHPWRHCAYAEAGQCAKLRLAPTAALERQTATYRAEGFPDNAGLWNTMVLARRRTDATLEFGRAWWDEISRHTPRDQVSFPYLLWKHAMPCAQLGNDIYKPGKSPHFNRGLHRGQRV